MSAATSQHDVALRAKIDAARADRGVMVAALEYYGAVANGPAWRCLFHEDAHASGSIFQDDKGVWRFKCHACAWNGEKSHGDAIDVVQRARRCDFRGALVHLGLTPDGARPAGRPARQEPAQRAPAQQTDPRDGGNGSTKRSEIDLDVWADQAAKRLQNDSALIKEIWRTRAVDRATLERYGVGVNEHRTYTSFPLRDAKGRVEAIKLHRLGGDGPKCLWMPKGIGRNRVGPHCIRPDARFTAIVAGEWKALALIAAGCSAFSVTSGEGSVKSPTDLPAAGIEIIRSGPPVAVFADDDEVGRAWGKHVCNQLLAAGIDARVVDVGLDAAAGLKDVGDLLVERAITDAKEPEAIRAELELAYEQSDPWFRFTVDAVLGDPATWTPAEYVPTGLGALDKALDGGLRCTGVHAFAGRSGRGKTQIVMQIALNAAQAGVPVGVVSLEMSRRELGVLISANLSGVPRSYISRGTVGEKLMPDLEGSVAIGRKLPLVLCDWEALPGAPTRSAIETLIRGGCKRFGWRMVVVDYLQLIAWEPSDTSENQAGCELSTMLKRLAMTCNIALVVVTAIRKSAALKSRSQQEKRPIDMDDILGAGRIVYDAQNVFHVDAEQGVTGFGETPIGLVRIRGLKTRYSGLGSRDQELQFRWRPSVGRIEDLETAGNSTGVGDGPF